MGAKVVEKSLTNFDKVPLLEEGPTIVTNYVLMNIGGKDVNASWTRTSEHGDVDSTVQLSVEGVKARYSHRWAAGDGWEVQSKRFELKPATKPMALLAYVVDNPSGIPTDNQAAPGSQIGEAMETTGISAGDLIKAVAKEVGGKESTEHWAQFQEFWETYV